MERGGWEGMWMVLVEEKQIEADGLEDGFVESKVK
jgi:hypothetical protein